MQSSLQTRTEKKRRQNQTSREKRRQEQQELGQQSKEEKTNLQIQSAKESLYSNGVFDIQNAEGTEIVTHDKIQEAEILQPEQNQDTFHMQGFQQLSSQKPEQQMSQDENSKINKLNKQINEQLQEIGRLQNQLLKQIRKNKYLNYKIENLQDKKLKLQDQLINYLQSLIHARQEKAQLQQYCDSMKGGSLVRNFKKYQVQSAFRNLNHIKQIQKFINGGKNEKQRLWDEVLQKKQQALNYNETLVRQSNRVIEFWLFQIAIFKIGIFFMNQTINFYLFYQLMILILFSNTMHQLIWEKVIKHKMCLLIQSSRLLIMILAITFIPQFMNQLKSDKQYLDRSNYYYYYRLYAFVCLFCHQLSKFYGSFFILMALTYIRMIHKYRVLFLKYYQLIKSFTDFLMFNQLQYIHSSVSQKSRYSFYNRQCQKYAFSLQSQFCLREPVVENSCTICWLELIGLSQNFQYKNPVIMLDCQHFFHQECIKMWKNQSGRNCPVCRSDFDIKNLEI